jgi:mono/diheme cytochrome c family protein
MRFPREATVAGWMGLAALSAGCRPDSRGIGGAASSPAPPSTSLIRAISDGERAALAALPPGLGQAEIEGSCVICHGTAMIQQQHKDSAGWAKTVNQMRTWGAPLTADQVPAVITYLTTHYGAATAAH